MLRLTRIANREYPIRPDYCKVKRMYAENWRIMMTQAIVRNIWKYEHAGYII